MVYWEDVISCPAAFNVVKLGEKYISFMDIFRPFSLDVFRMMMRVLHYYIYSIFVMFSNSAHRQAFFYKLDPGLINEEAIDVYNLENIHAYHIYQSTTKLSSFHGYRGR
jgi:hypothetical protein